MHEPLRKISIEAAEQMAVEAFSAIMGDEDRMSRFMAMSGLQADTIRAAAAAPRFFAGILDYVVSDEPLLIALATEMNIKPERLMEAHMALSPSEFE